MSPMERVLAQIKSGQSISREIAKGAGMSVHHVCRWTRLLEALGRIERAGVTRKNGRPVRPSTIWRAKAEGTA